MNEIVPQTTTKIKTIQTVLPGEMESFVKLMVLGWAVGFLVNFIGLYTVLILEDSVLKEIDIIS